MGYSKGSSTTHVVNKNSDNEFYKEIAKCIKELEGIFTIWKLICELTGRNFLYIYFGVANFTYQLELDGFGPNAIKIVKFIKPNLVPMQSRAKYRFVYRVILLVVHKLRALFKISPVMVLMQSKTLINKLTKLILIKTSYR